MKLDGLWIILWTSTDFGNGLKPLRISHDKQVNQTTQDFFDANSRMNCASAPHPSTDIAL
jgi:hypothetical protein